jgi:hypothetical protein
MDYIVSLYLATRSVDSMTLVAGGLSGAGLSVVVDVLHHSPSPSPLETPTLAPRLLLSSLLSVLVTPLVVPIPSALVVPWFNSTVLALAISGHSGELCPLLFLLLG